MRFTLAVVELMELSSRVQQLREAAGITQEELAARSGVARGSIQAIETGNANPKIKTLIDLGVALGSPVIEVASLSKITGIKLARHGQLLKDVPADFRNWGQLSEGIQAVCLYFVTGDDRFRELLPRAYQEALRAVRASLANGDSEDLP